MQRDRGLIGERLQQIERVLAELLLDQAKSENSAQSDASPAVQRRIRYLNNIDAAGRNLLAHINSLLEMDIVLEGETITVAAEVAQQIGEGRVRVICMKPTDGLKRGTVVRNTGHGITMPVGDGVLGHVFNVLGEPLDIARDQLAGIDDRWEIHRNPPAFDQLEPKAQMFETGIKVIDLLEPYVQIGRASCRERV